MVVVIRDRRLLKKADKVKELGVEELKVLRIAECGMTSISFIRDKRNCRITSPHDLCSLPIRISGFGGGDSGCEK